LVDRIAKQNDLSPLSIPNVYVEKLQKLSWPGNIRQLGNFVERLVLLSGHNFRRDVFDDLIKEIKDSSAIMVKDEKIFEPLETIDQLQREFKENELMYLNRVLQEVRWNKSEAARRLGISRSSLYRRLTTLERLI
jgi:DNA-binding NtrC family response regulator